MNSSIRVISFAVTALMLLCCGSSAQTITAQTASQAQSTQQNSPGKKDKKKTGSEEFGDAVVHRLLTQIRSGMEGHSSGAMLSAFDADKMDGYMTFEEQIRAMFEHYESFRIYYQIVQTSGEGTRGVALVNFQMEETPAASEIAPLRKANQIRFEFEQGNKGWKIVDVSPRGFFS